MVNSHPNQAHLAKFSEHAPTAQAKELDNVIYANLKKENIDLEDALK